MGVRGIREGKSGSPPSLGLDFSSLHMGPGMAALSLHLPERDFCRPLVFQRQAQGSKSENFKIVVSIQCESNIHVSWTIGMTAF